MTFNLTVFKLIIGPVGHAVKTKQIPKHGRSHTKQIPYS